VEHVAGAHILHPSHRSTRHGQFEAHTPSHEVGSETCSREIYEARECAQQVGAQDVSASRRERAGCRQAREEGSRTSKESCRSGESGGTRESRSTSESRCTCESRSTCEAGGEGRRRASESSTSESSSNTSESGSRSRTGTRAGRTRAGRTRADASRRRRRRCNAKGNQQIKESGTRAHDAGCSHDRTASDVTVATRS
jgi:hypothetical protein